MQYTCDECLTKDLCDQCDRPKYIFADNELPLKIWTICNQFSRQIDRMTGSIMRLSISEMKAACDAYNAYIDDFESVLLIESVAFPFIQQSFELSKPKKR